VAWCRDLQGEHAIHAQLTINGGPNATTAYIGWTPVPAQLRLVDGPPGGGAIDVTLRNVVTQTGGQVCFSTDRTPPFPTTLDLSLPADGTPVNLMIAGQFDKASRADGDAAIETVVAGTNQQLAVTRLMVCVRKDAMTLTNAERYRFLDAFATLNDRGMGTFSDFPSMHRDLGLDQAHGLSGFLPWHRAMLLDLERELQSIDRTVALPYWRFDAAAPSVFSAGFMGTPDANDFVRFEPGHPLESWVTDMGLGILRSANFLPANAPTNIRNESVTLDLDETANRYSPWRALMEIDPHGHAHTRFTGYLFDPATAAADPLFFLLHCNVDRLWAKWQWLKDRFDPTQPTSFSPLGSGALPIGHNLDDTLWPWNGETDNGRPPTAPGGAFPVSPITAAPGARPTLKAMIDYRGTLNAASWLGFDYDDVPFQ